MSGAKHNMKPVRSGMPKGRHVLLYVQEKQCKGRIVAGVRNMWVADLTENGWECGLVDSWSNADQLDAVLDGACLNKGETTIWLLRGWTDLVLTGLAELMDAGIITWRYVSLSGRSCIIKGAWRSRKITITAMPNWTGNRWDSWGDVSTDAAVARLMTAVVAGPGNDKPFVDTDELSSLETLATIVATCRMIGLPRVPPTAGAAGLLLWRSWLGPRLVLDRMTKTKNVKGKKQESVTVVGPLTYRPGHAQQAERHACYSLISRQLRRGYANESIYCVDVRSAYLLGLSTTPLPLMYHGTLHKPHVHELVMKICDKTGIALVRLNAEDFYYPFRANGRTVQCNGTFWTWLAGTELAYALLNNHVQEVWTAYLWNSICLSDSDRKMIGIIRASMERYNMPACAAAWRSIYSALVGRFAGWQRTWKESKTNAGFGRWAQWLQADPDTGDTVPYRAIAGRVQMLAEKTDRSDSVPLLYACVTAQVRWIVQRLCQLAEWPNIVSIAADSVWVTQDGWQKCLRSVSECGLSPDSLKTKAIYDRAWFTGKSAVVTERHGVKQLLMPGISKGAVVNSKGEVEIEHTDDWTSDDVPTAKVGVQRRRHKLSVQKILDKCRFEAIKLLPGEKLNTPLLGEYLLQPIKGERTIEDG